MGLHPQRRVWSQQGSKLVGTGAVGSAVQGSSVALSDDGNTAIVGGYGDNANAGAAWLFTRSGGVWTQQGSKLVGTGTVGAAFQGSSVSLAGDGNTVMVGGYGDNANAGAAWVFTQSGGVWTQQGSKLVGTGAVGAAFQGSSVALSDDGNTAIVGGHGDNSNAGAAWVFLQPASTQSTSTQSQTASPASKSSTLVVTPSTSIVASGPQGGPFSPSSFAYTLTATRGSAAYSITNVPNWLTASSTSGTVTRSGKTITFSINSSANSLKSGTYTGNINFNQTSRSATLTVNPALPVVTAANFSVVGGLGVTVGQVSATNSPTSFAITSGNTNGYFAINSSGVITTSATIAVPVGSYSLQVTASNAAGTSTPATIGITITASLQVPVVSAANFSAVDGLGVTVGQVSATNSPTSFAITSGNSSNYFAISATGIITTSATIAVPVGSYSLQVTASNAAGTSTPATIGITITAPLQVPVVSAANFSAVDGLGVTVGQVSATNSPTSFAITSGNTNGYFAISATGIITTSATIAVPVGSYSLQVTASNAAGTSTPATIGITITAPLQVPVVSAANFSAVDGLGVTVGQVSATNSPTSFAITSGNTNGYFAISATGIITTSATIAVPVGSYSLQVTASNAAGTSTPATIGITITASLGPSTPSFVQSVISTTNIPGVEGNAGNNFKYILPNSVRAGNALLVAATWPHGVTPTISDNVNGTWPAAIVTVDGGVGNYVSGFFLKTNVAAGVTTVRATFGSNQIPFQWNIFEINNVVGANGSTGTANVTGPNLATGSFTPGNNNASGGNLVVSYFPLSAAASSNPTSWVKGSGHTLYEADISWINNQGFPHATQYVLQTAQAAINPSVTATGDRADTYNCVAIALQVGSAGSPKPSSGIHIDKIIHFSMTANATTALNMQTPFGGNLRVLAADTGGQAYNSVTDSDSVTWSVAGGIANANNANAYIFYRQNAPANDGATLTLHMPAGGLGAANSWRIFDISNAAASSFDTSVFGAGQNFNGVGSVSNWPSITPGVSSGLTIALAGLGQGPGLSVSAPSGAIFDMIAYTNEIDADLYENADLLGHYYFSSNATQNWGWTFTNQGSNSSIGSVAATFH